MKRAVKIFLKTILWLFVAVLVLLILVQTPPVQNFARKKVQAWLQKKLNTRFEVGKVYIGLPSAVILENVYLEDRAKDTLLYGGRIRANVSLFKLIKGDINIGQLKLENLTAKVKRQLPDTVYNFQFVIDAFAGKEEKTPAPKDDTSSLKMQLDRLVFNNIRLLYDDDVTGNDVTVGLKHFDTRIEKFDPAKMVFDIPSVSIKGLTARVYQYTSLVKPVEDTSSKSAPSALPTLTFKNIDLEDVNIDYRNKVSGFYTQTTIGNLEVSPKEFDLNKRRVVLNKLYLDDATASILLNNKPASEDIKEKLKDVPEKVDEQNWHIAAEDLRIIRTRARFDNNTNPRQKQGMDYAHLDANNINLFVDNFLMSNDTIAIAIKRTSLKERSGLDLQQLKGDFIYNDKGASAKDFLVQTNGTRIQHTIKIEYPSIERLKENIEELQVQAILPDSYVKVKDILLFVPSLKQQPIFNNPSEVFTVNARIAGPVDNLKAEVLQIRGLRHTVIDVSGTVAGLPDAKNLSGNIRINNIRTSRFDLAGFLPESVTKQLNIPASLSIKGNIQGNTKHAKADINLRTSSGDIAVNGVVNNYSDSINADYDLKIITRQLNAGQLLRNETLQTITSSFDIKGRGLTLKTADAKIKGIIQSAGFKQYTYKNLTLDGTIKNQRAEGVVAIVDPNIHFTANTAINMASDSTSFSARIIVDSIKTEPLHLTPKPLIYRGKINADFTSIDPNALNGKLDIAQSLLVTGEKRLQIDTIRLVASTAGDSNSIKLESDIASADIHGKYALTEIGTVFQQAIQPYFAIKQSNEVVQVKPYDFTIDLNVMDNPAIKVFAPSIERFRSLTVNGRFTSTNGWNAKVDMPVLVMATTNIQNLQMQAGSGNDSLIAKTTIAQLSLAGNNFYNISLNNNIANNNIHFTTRFEDKVGKEMYRLSGLFQQPQPGNYVFSLNSGLLLNYQEWTVAPDNSIRIGKDDLRVTNFILNRNFQQLSLKTRGEQPNSPLEAYFTSFSVATVAAFATPDSLNVDGTLDGQVTFRDVLKKPAFAGDLTITNLKFKQDTVGNVLIKANNSTAGSIQANVTVTGRGNHVEMNGHYYTQPVSGNDFNFDLSIDTLNLASVQGATMGAISQATGNVTGKFKITGTVDKPLVNGNLHMHKTAFNFTMLNSYYRIDDEVITVNNQGIRFDRFLIKDSADNSATLDGTAYTSNFKNYRFDMTLRARNFRALNTTKKDNELYYGKLFFSSNIGIKGTEQLPVIDGTLTIEDKTDITVAIPQREPGVAQREGIVQFVDMDAPENDTLFMRTMASFDSLNTSNLKGLDVSANIEVKKEAIFNLIVDEANGDFLRMRGEGMLNGSIDQSGKITLAGTYEMQEGTYELTFNLLRRKFVIQEGSRITWTGELTKADVNITAVYIANTSSLDLVKNQLPENITATERNKYLQRLPYEVTLKMEGELLQPSITFDIRLPENKNYVVSNEIVTTARTRLDQLRQEPSELNKQVFALLLLNRFITDNPFQTSGGITAESFARQSASKLLSEQLNQLAADLIHGVDVNINLESQDDYTTGEQRTRTDLNVGLSKRLLNDRLTVTLGSNFELEGPQTAQQDASTIIGNIALDYRLSEDGRYLLRAYRKNEYEGVIDGYVIETGVGFVITLDYNRFWSIFLGKKGREERRQRRRKQTEEENKKLQQQQQQTVTAPKNATTN